MHDTLLNALQPYFPLHRTRLHLLVQVLCAMLTLGTVRLPRLAGYLESSGHSEAHRYRRLQRFFAGLDLKLKWVVTFVMACMPEGQHWLILDCLGQSGTPWDSAGEVRPSCSTVVPMLTVDALDEWIEFGSTNVPDVQH